MPPEAVPNGVHPHTLEKPVIATSVVFMSIGIMASAMDLWHHRKQLRRTEYLIILSLPFLITYTSIGVYYSPYTGHVWETPLSEMFSHHFHSLQVAMFLLLAPAGFLPKVAILCMYLEVFRVDRQLKMLTHIALTLEIAAYAPWLVLVPVYCASRGQESPLDTQLRCINLSPWSVALSSLNLIADVFLYVLPIPPMVKLQLPIRRKLAIMAVFATALLGIAAGGACLAYRATLLTSPDIMWTLWKVGIAVDIENWTALIVCCTPGCAGYLKQLRAKRTAVTTVIENRWSRALRPDSRLEADRFSDHSSFRASVGPLRDTYGNWTQDEKRYGGDELEVGYSHILENSIGEVHSI